jgi:hypothetical protein
MTTTWKERWGRKPLVATVKAAAPVTPQTPTPRAHTVWWPDERDERRNERWSSWLGRRRQGWLRR